MIDKNIEKVYSMQEKHQNSDQLKTTLLKLKNFFLVAMAPHGVNDIHNYRTGIITMLKTKCCTYLYLVQNSLKLINI